MSPPKRLTSSGSPAPAPLSDLPDGGGGGQRPGAAAEAPAARRHSLPARSVRRSRPRARGRPGSAPIQNCQYCGVRPARRSCSDLEQDGADQPAVEVADAADHEDEQHVRRAVEGEHVEGDELGRLGEERAGDPGIGGRRGVDRDEAAVDGNADRAGAQGIVADASAATGRRASGRSGAPATKSTNSDGEAVGVGGGPEDVELEQAEEGPMATPCSPSAPPVSQAAWFAISPSTSATPSVTMSRVRSAPRRTRKLVAKPRSAAAAAAATRPTQGLADRRAWPGARRRRRRARRRPRGQARRCRRSRGSGRGRPRTAR